MQTITNLTAIGQRARAAARQLARASTGAKNKALLADAWLSEAIDKQLAKAE